MIRRRSEDQEEGGVTSGSWQDMAALCRSGTLEDTGAWGDQPSWARTQQETAQRTGALRRQKREESQPRRGKAMEILEGL